MANFTDLSKLCGRATYLLLTFLGEATRQYEEPIVGAGDAAPPKRDRDALLIIRAHSQDRQDLYSTARIGSESPEKP